MEDGAEKEGARALHEALYWAGEEVNPTTASTADLSLAPLRAEEERVLDGLEIGSICEQAGREESWSYLDPEEVDIDVADGFGAAVKELRGVRQNGTLLI